MWKPFCTWCNSTQETHPSACWWTHPQNSCNGRTSTHRYTPPPHSALCTCLYMCLSLCLGPLCLCAYMSLGICAFLWPVHWLSPHTHHTPFCWSPPWVPCCPKERKQKQKEAVAQRRRGHGSHIHIYKYVCVYLYVDIHKNMKIYTYTP